MGLNNKRGQFFTMAAIIILSIFLLSYIIYTSYSDRKSIHNRIDSMNSFVSSLKEDFRRQVYISGFRIIFLFEKKIVENGNPITDLNSSFQEAFYNGTINDEYQDLLNGVIFNDISNSLSEKASRDNLNLILTPHKLTIYQEDPWHITISLNTDILITDKNNLASWNSTENITSLIDITNFEDPLYVLNTNGLVANKINKSTYVFSETDLSNLTIHSINSYYIASATGPSFLDRLEGKTSANPNGIESLVYLPSLSAQGIALKDKSVVDYIYFSSDNPGSHNIQGMASWFRLDDTHLAVYNVSGKAV